MGALTTERGTRAIRIANCSGFYGDRISAAREMVDGGPIDVLVGDYLAELTMLILWKARRRDAALGYAATFLQQCEDVLGTCMERGIRIVTNAGGLNPAGCADAVRSVAARLGLDVQVAHIDGDDLMPLIDQPVDPLRRHLDHMDTGQPLRADPVSANAYLGGWGIAAALGTGADVVVCPRVTDAALVVGPAAWWWDWEHDDWDRLAGAVVAGHIIECGAQTTGGNFTFFRELPDLGTPLGFPIAEVDEHGDAIITKHPGTGGAVTIDTVTAQLVYEIGGVRYPNPDVVARFDSIQLADAGVDRVLVSGVRGEPAPPTAKVCINLDAGLRNRVTFVLTGLHQQDKAHWVREALFRRLGGEQRFDDVDVRLVVAPPDAPTQEQASGRLHVSVRSSDERLVGRAFSSAAVELALANYPGFFVTSPPGAAQSIGEYWPALVDRDVIHQRVVLQSGETISIGHPPAPADDAVLVPIQASGPRGAPVRLHAPRSFGARSGDKGGNANVGIWARNDDDHRWLVDVLTPDAIHRLLPETTSCTLQRHELPNLRALNIVIEGFLGAGVASNNAFDPQAKGLGEYLLARLAAEMAPEAGHQPSHPPG